MTAYGTCLMWDSLGEEAGCVAAAWYEENDDYYVAGELGLINGTEGVYAYHTDAHTVRLQLVDIAEGTLEEEVKIQVSAPKAEEISGNVVGVYSGYEKGLYVADAEVLYHYECSNGELTSLLSWMDLGVSVDRDQLKEIHPDEENRLVLYGYDENKKQASVYRMKEVNKEEFEQRSIEIAYIWKPSKGLEKYIDDFNVSQSEIVVSMKRYEDETALQLDLIQGEAPDILDLYNLDIGEYAEKGILENLDPYLESSDILNKDDILPGLLEAMQKNGHIYCLFPHFTFSIVILQEGLAEDGVISTEKFLKLKPEEGSYLCEYSTATVLSELFNADKERYIDWENRTCCFNDGRYAELMRQVKSAALTEQYNTTFDMMTPAEQIYQNKYLAKFSYVSSIHSYVDCREVFDGHAEIVGYPNSSGEELYPIKAGYGILGINQDSLQKDASWKFMEYYINAYAENKKSASAFSILEDAFEKDLYPQMKPNVEEASLNIYLGELEDCVYEFPEEYREKLRHMTENVVWVELSSSQVKNIIWEESSYFLYGDKTAEEVADIIQSRVSLYRCQSCIDENQM